MKKALLRRYLGLALALAFAISCIGAPAYAADGDPYDPGDSGIVPAGQAKDIFLNIDSDMMEQLAAASGNSNLSSDDVMNDLKKYIIENSEGAYNEATIRVRSNVTTIDTTDLSSWYVYDHYDTGKGTATGTPAITVSAELDGNGNPRYYSGTESIFDPIKRPYYPISEVISKGYNDGKAYSNVYTIEYLLNNGAELGLYEGTLNGTNYNGNKASNVRKLKEHIYSFSDDDGAHMYFMGYGDTGHTASSSIRHNITDFLFYPATTEATKTIEFEINSEDVRTHSMIGAGFLLNAGVYQSEGVFYIKGYILYIVFTPQGSDTTGSNIAPTGAKMFLYKINEDTPVSVNAFHTRDGSPLTYCSLSYCTKIADVENNEDLFLNSDDGSFKDTVSLKIEFDETSLSVEADGESADFSVDMLNKDISTGFYGFGPLVDYCYATVTPVGGLGTGLASLGVNHYCQTTSSYKFSNLKMSFASDVLDTLLNTQFYTAQNVDRFYVNLISEEIDDTNPSFWDGIALLRSDKVFYVTNAENSVIGTGGANGNNGLELSQITNYIDMIKELGDYILMTRLSAWDDNDLQESELDRPAVGFDLLGSDDYAEDEVIDRIEQKMLAGNPVEFSFRDKSEYNTGDITKFEVKWYGPDSNLIQDSDETILYSAGREDDENEGFFIFDLAFLLDIDAVPGTYRVEIVAVGEDEDTGNETRSNPVSRSFELVRDELPPTCDIGSKSTGTVDGQLYKGDSVWLDLSDDAKGWGAQAYRIGYGPTGETLSDMDDILWEGTGTGVERLSELWLNPPHQLNIPNLKQEAECLYVQVWDWVGNTYLYPLPIAPYTVTISNDNAFELDLGLGSGFIMPDGGYTLHQYNSTVNTPPASNEQAGGGKYELIGFNTDKYAETGLPNFMITGDMVLYPIFEYVGLPVDVELDYDNSNPVPNIVIDLTDSGGNPITPGDGSGYFVVEYDEDDPVPGSFTAAEMEELANSGSGWVDLDGSSTINIPSGELTSGKKYVVLIKVVDDDGNVTYKNTDEIECYIPFGGGNTNTESGSVTVNNNGGGTVTGITGGETIKDGEKKTVVITPNEGKKVLDVVVNGESAKGGMDGNSLTITGDGTDKKVDVIFTDEGNKIVSTPPTTGGSMTITGDIADKSTTGLITAYEPGTKVTLGFTAEEGYFLRDVIINGVSYGAEELLEIEITEDMEIIPLFSARVDLNSGDHYAYIIGYVDGTVRPEGNITREEVATIFFRLLTEESRAIYLDSSNSFNDISGSRWSNTAISTLASAGIVTGKTGTRFDPEAYMTRAEFATIASRFSKIAVGSSSFTDIKNHWAETDIINAYLNGWVNGYDDNTFRPNERITRAEVMAIVNKILERNPADAGDLLDEMTTWSDNMNTAKWYYLDVQEATNAHHYDRRDSGTGFWTELRENFDWSVYER